MFIRKYYLLIFAMLLVGNTIQSQTRGTKIGYIDMEYILQNVPDYKEAQIQLEQKAQKWKQEIEVKKNEINKLKEALKAEKALLTKGLIEDRSAEITFQENEILELEQKRFGPYGDLMTQKLGLTKPIQDQVFTAAQDIAEAKKYDFIFDKSSDLTMLFAAKRFDISDQIIRVLNRAEKREQLSKKQLKELEAKELKEDEEADGDSGVSDRQKALNERKAARDKAIAERAALQEEKKKEAEAKRAKIIAEREAKKSGVTTATSSSNSETTTSNANSEKEAAVQAAVDAKQKQIDDRAKAVAERKRILEENRKAAEDKRAKIIAERKADAESARTQSSTVVEKTGTVSESTSSEEVKNDTIISSDETRTPSEIAIQKKLDERAKVLEERKKALEEYKKALEEKKKKALQDEEDAKKGIEEKIEEKTEETNEKTNNN
jgi:Skp family chaperone for outer membrane proteins